MADESQPQSPNRLLDAFERRWNAPERFARLRLVLLVIVHVILFAMAAIAPFREWAWGTDGGTGAIAIMFAGLTLLWFLPLLQLFDRVSEIHGLAPRVLQLEPTIERLAAPHVPVRKHRDMEPITQFIRDRPGCDITVYLGFEDDQVLTSIVALFTARTAAQNRLFINPKVIANIKTTAFDAVVSFATSGGMVLITDCPRDACVLFAESNNSKECVIIRRYGKKANVKGCWSASVAPGSDYADYLFETYNYYFNEQGQCFALTSAHTARCIRKLYYMHREENQGIARRSLNFSSREVAYAFAVDNVKAATRSVHAIDWYPPRHWDAGQMRKYKDAHTAAQCEKRRVVVFPEQFGELCEITPPAAQTYDQYIGVQREIGVELRFIRADTASSNNARSGFIVIDAEVVYYTDMQKWPDGSKLSLDYADDFEDIFSRCWDAAIDEQAFRHILAAADAVQYDTFYRSALSTTRHRPAIDSS